MRNIVLNIRKNPAFAVLVLIVFSMVVQILIMQLKDNQVEKRLSILEKVAGPTDFMKDLEKYAHALGWEVGERDCSEGGSPLYYYPATPDGAIPDSVPCDAKFLFADENGPTGGLETSKYWFVLTQNWFVLDDGENIEVRKYWNRIEFDEPVSRDQLTQLTAVEDRFDSENIKNTTKQSGVRRFLIIAWGLEEEQFHAVSYAGWNGDIEPNP
ncbi:MAG: hypothetical protein UU77_C0065G0006 [candidate division WWE3 bacterium GW2011_GWC1_41_7]|jgi:hypothetical protein|uniref:Uncharacterized protein n=2 Tax=Katanobacteria TaxID=422282 RepID=A0A0G0X1D6_UNCKA|nr:MAG: hypothetical protein UU77_C0065G0006 [candidate division WWE3 bacterium GW2011_GWC1_41_7]OGC58211.1 MAG: hypothetical protein A2976_03830 [candidate division WWE3 bacterium RIFCSPLOWO2_01_FULL_41_9]